MSEEEHTQEVMEQPEGKTLVEVFTAEAPIEPPVIRKKRGRQKGWRKKRVDFKPVVEQTPEEKIQEKYPAKDEMTLLKEEMARLQNQILKMRSQATREIIAFPQMESPAFKGRPLPDPLPEGFPEIDPLSGDKTPAVVEWFRDNDPQEYEIRYKTRVTHLNPKKPKAQSDYIIDEETGRRIKMMARTDNASGLNTTPRTYGG